MSTGSPKPNITAAMRERCRQLAHPRTEMTKRSLGTLSFSFHAPITGGGGLTYVMVDKLESAGLIRWVDAPDHHSPHQVRAQLTDAGRAAIDRKAQPKDPHANGCPDSPGLCECFSRDRATTGGTR